jgi:alpha-tubulin suppressor-like RCC1 family protein
LKQFCIVKYFFTPRQLRWIPPFNSSAGPVRTSQVACASDCSLFLSDEGQLFYAGESATLGTTGLTASGVTKDADGPTAKEMLSRVLKADVPIEDTPVEYPFVANEGERITQVCLNGRATHGLILTSEGSILSVGTSANGALGLKEKHSSPKPSRIMEVSTMGGQNSGGALCFSLL